MQVLKNNAAIRLMYSMCRFDTEVEFMCKYALAFSNVNQPDLGIFKRDCYRPLNHSGSSSFATVAVYKRRLAVYIDYIVCVDQSRQKNAQCSRSIRCRQCCQLAQIN